MYRHMFDPHSSLLDMVQNENALILGDDEIGNEMMGLPAGDDHDPDQRHKKKQYHRHTPEQIHEMETFFNECPHPDDAQRRELGRRLGLEPLQVKFWFQNKRTQMKTQHERIENAQLRHENQELRAENIRYKEAIANATCPQCGGPAMFTEISSGEQQMRIENASLREQLERMTGVRHARKSVLSYPPLSLPPPTALPPRSLDLGVGNFGEQGALIGDIYGASNLLRSGSSSSDSENPLIVEFAVAAMEELVQLAQTGEPLWVPNADNSFEVLNEEEYIRLFPRAIGSNPMGMKTEASRDSAVVIMNHINLVEILMDVNQWSNMFCSIVSRAMTLDVLSTGIAGNYDGALQLMSAELQVGSPFIKSHEVIFVRYCKQHGEGTWAVVDVSFDNLRATVGAKCKRRPSGCFIQELPNGYSKVTWIEHVEIDEREVLSTYKKLVISGLGFGAKRWVATLERQCERLACVMASTISSGDTGVISSLEGRKGMLKLAERMVVSFCNGIGASTTHTWTTLSRSSTDDVRVMTRKSMDDPGRPAGIVLSAATSFWLPVLPKLIFDFLRNENTRSEWDILSNGGTVEEVAHIAIGSDPGNSVSLLRVNSKNSTQSNMLILQESCTDATGCYIIYAPVDIVAMNVVLGGGDPDYVPLLPSGFSILPDGPKPDVQDGGIPEVGSGGSLLTVAFQILVDSAPSARLSLGSVATVNSLIKCTVDRIRDAVTGNGVA